MPYARRQSGIYAITHLASGTVYIGQSSHLEKRLSEHRRILRHGSHDNSYLQRAFRKYGEGAFDFALLEVCDEARLTEREQWWLDHFRYLGKVYNRGLCADSPVRGTKRQGKPLSPEHRAALLAANVGKVRSPESRVRMSEAHKGKTLPLEQRAKIAQALTGRPCSPETREKIGSAQRGRTYNDGRGAKISAAAIARGPLSAEHRAKISAGMKRYRANG